MRIPCASLLIRSIPCVQDEGVELSEFLVDVFLIGAALKDRRTSIWYKKKMCSPLMELHIHRY